VVRRQGGHVGRTLERPTDDKYPTSCITMRYDYDVPKRKTTAEDIYLPSLPFPFGIFILGLSCSLCL